MTQRSQYQHLQRVPRNKAFNCFTTNWDSALDLEVGPNEQRPRQEKTEKKHINKRRQRTLLTVGTCKTLE
jgi:hypothetical protein